MAETNGLLNRRTGKSGTEGSNPSVSAIKSLLNKDFAENDCTQHFPLAGGYGDAASFADYDNATSFGAVKCGKPE